MSKKKKWKPAAPIQESKPEIKQQKYRASTTTFSIYEHRLPLLFIALLTIGLYFQTAGFDYVLDDKMVITDNKFTQQGIKGIPDIFRFESFRGNLGEQTNQLEGDRYRPLSIASFAVEKSWFDDNKTISHLINILLYAFTGLLLYRVLLFMFPVVNDNKQWYFTVPFIATSIFIAHPLHTEVVANIKGRDEIFAFLGEAGALFFTFKYLAAKKVKFLFFSFLSIWAAMLSKEGAITFLAALPLTVHFFTKATAGDKIKTVLPVLAGVILYLVMRVNAIGYLMNDLVVTDLMNNPFYEMSTGDRTATIFYTLLLYLKLLIFPHPLTHDYYPYHIPEMSWSNGLSILSLFVHIGLIVLIIKDWRKKTVWAYSAAFYIITLSIVSNLAISVGTFMNERFVYHASLGFCIAFAWFLKHTLGRNNLLKKIAGSIFLLALIAFSIRSYLRIPVWRNNHTLDSEDIKYSPNSARANCFFAVDIWQNMYQQLPTNADTARRIVLLNIMKKYFDKSVAILPKYGAAQSMRAAIAGEFHKLNLNYDDLIRVFEEVNRSATNEKFVTDYLKYINKMVIKKSDAEKLAAFYTRMINFYEKELQFAPLTNEYKTLLQNIQQKIPGLN